MKRNFRITTGQHHAALLTNNAQWESCAVSAGLSSGDMVFPIVFAPELHYDEFKSSVADMKNSVAVSFNAICNWSDDKTKSRKCVVISI